MQISFGKYEGPQYSKLLIDWNKRKNVFMQIFKTIKYIHSFQWIYIYKVCYNYCYIYRVWCYINLETII